MKTTFQQPTTHSEGIRGVPETQSYPHCPSPIRSQSVTFTIWERSIRALGAVPAKGKKCICICTCTYSFHGTTQAPRRFLWRSYYGFPELPSSPTSLQCPQDNSVPTLTWSQSIVPSFSTCEKKSCESSRKILTLEIPRTDSRPS